MQVITFIVAKKKTKQKHENVVVITFNQYDIFKPTMCPPQVLLQRLCTYLPPHKHCHVLQVYVTMVSFLTTIVS